MVPKFGPEVGLKLGKNTSTIYHGAPLFKLVQFYFETSFSKCGNAMMSGLPKSLARTKFFGPKFGPWSQNYVQKQTKETRQDSINKDNLQVLFVEQMDFQDSIGVDIL